MPFGKNLQRTLEMDNNPIYRTPQGTLTETFFFVNMLESIFSLRLKSSTIEMLKEYLCTCVDP